MSHFFCLKILLLSWVIGKIKKAELDENIQTKTPDKNKIEKKETAFLTHPLRGNSVRNLNKILCSIHDLQLLEIFYFYDIWPGFLKAIILC